MPVLEAHAALAASEEHRRWVISFYPKTTEWTMADMKNTISMFQKAGYREDIYDEELVVHDDADATTLHVNGIHNISTYCQHENPSACDGRWYRYSVVEGNAGGGAEAGSQIPDLFSLKIQSKIEEERPLESTNQPPQWSSAMKLYRLAKKIVYTDEASGVRYTIAMTKTSAAPAQTMVSSGVSARQPSIGYSILCPEGIAPKEVVVSIVRMLQIVERNRFPMTTEQQKRVLSEYDALVEKVRDKKFFKDPYYLAPKPLTLEQVHLSDPGITYGQLTILDGYAVTDKADGERMLMYIGNDGAAYLINSAFEVRGTGWRVKREMLYNTLLDGEFLSLDKRLDGSDKDLFAAFDIYFVGGDSVMGLPLIESPGSAAAPAPTPTPAKPAKPTKPVKEQMSGKTRYELVKSVLAGSLWEHDRDAALELVAKKHIAANGNAMFAACRQLLEEAVKKGARYDIDGLVFTPASLPVLGYYPGKPVTIKSASSTWDRVLKWKPPQQNSIDFCVTLDKNPVKNPAARGTSYAKLMLSCGYSALKNEEISVSRGLKLLQTRISERDLKDNYTLKSFTPQYRYENGIEFAYIPYQNGVIRAENGDEIVDGAVVEFGYDLGDKRPISYRWRAMRVRNDKMRSVVTPAEDVQPRRARYQIKTIKANDWKTATSVWKSIHEPVTREMITGVRRAPQIVKEAVDLQARLLGSDAVYYGRNVTREHLLSVEMLNFHNSVIKDNLYKWQTYPKNNLLELACGMAGDLNRWQDPVTGFAFRNILGVDLVRDNITKAVDGAYARVLKPRYGAPRRHQNYVFVIGDCAKPLQNGAAARGHDRDSEDVLRELYGKSSGRRYLTIIPPFARDRFDMVSCQFAIHYFFEKREKLEGFMANVRDNLRPGGLFITTFMDGASVERLIREKGKKGLVEGRKLDGTAVVWAIRRIRDASIGDDPEDAAEQEAASDASEEAYEDIPSPPSQPNRPALSTSSTQSTATGGAPPRKTSMIEVLDPATNGKKELQLVNVPGAGDCMFISLEVATFGKDKSSTRNGIWMRTKIVSMMRQILRGNDDRAKELYEDMKMHIDNISPEVRESAEKGISKKLYSSSSRSEEGKDYAERMAGYLDWMSQRKVWGTQIELRIAVDVLERPILIYQTDATSKRTSAHMIGEDKYPNAVPVMVWYNGIDHYKALLAPPVEEPEAVSPQMPTPPPASTPALAPVPVQPEPEQNDEDRMFGRIIDVYLENTNRLIPEYLVDFNLLYDYANRYGLELVQDGMFSDTYKAFKEKSPDAFPEFDKDTVQQQFSFLNRWAVFRRKQH